MKRNLPRNIDFLAARLHGRRRQMAEGERLDALCRIRTLPEFGRAVCEGAGCIVATDIQRRLVRRAIDELSYLVRWLPGAMGRPVDWLRVRFQVENAKVLLRGMRTGRPLEELRPYLVPLPNDLALDAETLASSDSPKTFARHLPKGPVRRALKTVLNRRPEGCETFLMEAAMDRAYLGELLARVARLPEEDSNAVRPIVRQEANIFQMLLVTRGRFHYGIEREDLVPMHLRGSGLSRGIFGAALAASSLAETAPVAASAVDDLPTGWAESPDESKVTVLEVLAWSRYLRLANAAFRRSHMCPGAMMAFAAIRRIELANLILLAEGIRAGLSAESIRARLLPRAAREVARV